MTASPVPWPSLILVCGSRHYGRGSHIGRILAEYNTQAPRIIHGAARGADQLAGRHAEALGFEVEAHPADWAEHGKAAGPIRNREMLDLEPDLVIAFGFGRGTIDTTDEAQRRGIQVRQEE